MNIPFLSSLFKEKKKTLFLSRSLLIKKLIALEDNKTLFIYENITIYHHAQSFFIPLLILDQNRGIYLFEYKEWSYDELKNSTISKATHQESTEDTLAFENAHDFIRVKFNELIHSDGVKIFNFLIMENLNTSEYEHLDISFKELLPKHRIMFNDSTKKEIIHKIESATTIKKHLPTHIDIMGNLLIQYLIIDKDKNKEQIKHFCTRQQIDFIDSKLEDHCVLNAFAASGKTSCILLKAILEKLRDPSLHIVIIQATTLACDRLKQRLINSIEHAIVEIDITTIEVLTPMELVNKHLNKLHKPELEIALHIDTKLMKKKFNVADLILCDDADLYEYDFIKYLEHIQKKSSLILVQNHDSELKDDSNYHFTKNFRNKTVNIKFKKANQHAKTLQIVAKLLKEHKADDILIVSDNLSKKRLAEDFEHFIKDEAILFDSSQNLLYQKLDSLILASYNQISTMESRFVILLDIETSPVNEVNYALNLSTETTYIVYEEESIEIEKLKGKFEDNKN